MNQVQNQYDGTAQEADYFSVEEPVANSKNLPALKYEVYRHPMMKEVETDYSKQSADSMKLNEELGLHSQAQMESDDIFKKDVDELTNTNDFFQISHQALRKLFQIDKMNQMCWGYNARELVRKSLRPFAGNIICAVLCVAFLITALLTAGLWTHTIAMTIHMIGRVVNVLSWVATVCFGFATFGTAHRKAEYEFAQVKLNIEPVETTSIKIPYGAKLKMRDAKNTGIFEEFTLAAPKFSTEKFIIEETERRQRPMVFDPAILGVTKDKRFFMICWWDIQHDIERTKDEIEKYVKFKIPS